LLKRKEKVDTLLYNEDFAEVPTGYVNSTYGPQNSYKCNKGV